MGFLKIYLRFTLAISVITLAVTRDADPLTITCQSIHWDDTIELNAPEMRESNDIVLKGCTIDSQPNYSDNNHVYCCSCSSVGIEEWLWRGRSVSETARLDSTKLQKRAKRQGNAERPLHTSSNERVLQTGHTYQLPCPVVAPGDVIIDIVWFKGSSCDPKKRQLILQHYNPPGGTLVSPSPHYQFTDTDYGLIIESANQTDSDRYWCKAYKKSIGKFVEDFLDLIVLGETFPMYRWPNTVGDIQKLTVNFEEGEVITCPVMCQTGARLDDITLYWSHLNTEDGQSMDIVFPDIGVATAGQYSLDSSNNLVVHKFNDREEMYCCHVFQDGTDPRQGCVRVLWRAIQEQKYPVISGYGDVKTPENHYDIKLESRQDFFPLECFVNSVYPKPEVSWSMTDCDGEKTTGFSTCNDWTYDDELMTYNAISKLYLHNLPLGSFSCTFNCTSLGGAITNGRASSSVQISRGVVEVQNNYSYVLVFILTLGFVTLLVLMVFGCHSNIVSRRKRRQMDEEGHPQMALSMMHNPQQENAHEDDNEGSKPMESSPMMIHGSESNGNAIFKGPFLISQKTPWIIFTDDTYKWISVGQLVTKSFIPKGIKSGFTKSFIPKGIKSGFTKSFIPKDISGLSFIRDVIPAPTQDGGLTVIDSIGMHQFTSEYHYKFVHLYKQLPGRYLCVSYFTTNKLLFGLVMGKLVIFDPDKTEVSTFGSILPVGNKEVELADITVDCQGFVFAADTKGRAISMFDPDGVYIKRVEIDIEPKFLFAHTTEMKFDLCVSSESTVLMYEVDRKSHYPYRANMGAAKYIIDEKTAEEDSFCSGGVVVRDGKLFLVNKLNDDKNVQVLQRDEAGGVEEHKFIVAVSEDEAATVTSRNIKGVAFANEDEILVYFENAVYVFKRTKTILSSIENEPAVI